MSKVLHDDAMVIAIAQVHSENKPAKNVLTHLNHVRV